MQGVSPGTDKGEMEKYSLIPKASRCPTCLGECGHVLYTVDSEQAAQHYVLRELDPERNLALKAHIEHLWGQRSCDIVRCANCGFCFADPYVGGDAPFYDLAHDPSSYPGWKWEFGRTLNALVELRAEGKLRDFLLLEIGAGDGAFIKRIAPALTPKQNVLCTEYSAYGIDAVQEYGVDCRSQDVRVFPPEEYAGRFGVICMFQVLEHLDRLDELFNRLNFLSTNGAHLFIAVPNERRVEFNELHGSLLDMPPNHIGRWNRESFKFIAQRHGWGVVKHEVEVESPKRRLAKHVIYRYVRKRQDRHTLANRVERVRWPLARRILKASAVGLYASGSLPEIYTLLKAPMLGDSQWVHLQKHVAR